MSNIYTVYTYFSLYMYTYIYIWIDTYTGKLLTNSQRFRIGCHKSKIVGIQFRLGLGKLSVYEKKQKRIGPLM